MRRGSEKLLEILEEPHLSGVYLKESNQIHIVKSEEKFPGGSERREEKSFRIKPRAFFVKEKKMSTFQGKSVYLILPLGIKVLVLKCCTQYASKFGKLSSGHRTGNGQFSFQSQRKAIPKSAQTLAQMQYLTC